VSANDGAGRDALLTYDGFTRVFEADKFPAAAARLRPGVPRSRAFAVYRRIYPGASLTDMATIPPAVTNLRRTRSTPTLLAAVLGGLGVIAVGYAAATARWRRRQDLAVLAALGAGPRWLSQVSLGQVLAIVVPTLVGVPIGIFLGARVFQAFARHLGVVDDPAVPVVASITLAVVTLAVATLVTLAVGRGGQRDRSGRVLRAE
jgi:predicted lysophospholipase L1 biosynthesis ABC-type transport system permease subunit